MGRGGRREGAGRPKGSRNKRTIAKVRLLPARAHRQTVEEMPLDILIAAARDKTQPIELRLAAAKAAAPYYHAKISSRPPKASFEMTDTELQTAIAREKEHQLRANPGQHQIREVSRRGRHSNSVNGWQCSKRRLARRAARVEWEAGEDERQREWVIDTLQAMPAEGKISDDRLARAVTSEALRSVRGRVSRLVSRLRSRPAIASGFWAGGLRLFPQTGRRGIAAAR
jgi:hypothetical protein